MFPFVPSAWTSIESFLRASGGVSDAALYARKGAEFSPRKRRCFSDSPQTFDNKIVFSAQAEVFPTSARLRLLHVGFLRASGGVSTSST